MPSRLAAFLSLVTALLAVTPTVGAQEPASGTASAAAVGATPDVPTFQLGQIVALDLGQRAPWTGMLIAQQDLVSWRLEIEHLRFRLERDVQLEALKAELRLDAVQQHLQLERAACASKEALHIERQTQLAAQLKDSAKQVERAAERKWYESPLLWFATGVGGTVVAALAFR